MFLFPVIYILSFVSAIATIFRNRQEGLLHFLIFGLPIYITALSVSFMYGFAKIIPLLQPFKEIVILSTLLLQVYTLRRRVTLHIVDKLVLAYFIYTTLYTVLPIGTFGFVDRLVALKSISFFPLIYFTGRLFNLRELYVNKYYHLICAVTIASAAVLLFEVVKNQHLQTITGYADYNYYFFGQEPSGNYGLSWTFETQTGLKRFASFFANPLEHSASTVITMAILAGLYTDSRYRIKPNAFGIIVLCCTLFSIFFALSRSALVSYFFLIYVYAFLTRKKYILQFIHAGVVLAVLYLVFMLTNKDLREFIIDTISFQNASSLSHVLEWLDGINAMIQHPLGIGLGESGRVANELGENVGGENQLIIIGVQAGIIALSLYVAIYVSIVKTAWRSFYFLKGKEKKICLSILLLKIAFIFPMMTSELESSTYISYITWFLSGLVINIAASHKQALSFKPAMQYA